MEGLGDKNPPLLEFVGHPFYRGTILDRPDFLERDRLVSFGDSVNPKYRCSGAGHSRD